MKVVDSLKGLAGRASVRAVGATAVALPLASIGGGIAYNHNETFLRDDGASEAEQEGTAFRGELESVREAAARLSLRAVAPVAALVPVASLLGGMNLGNHNETFLQERLG